MTKQELIGELRGMQKRNNWDDGMGRCSVGDFLQIPQGIRDDAEIMGELWRAVENRNATELERAGHNVDGETLGDGETWQNRVWEMWTNGDIEFDYADIQSLVNQYAKA